MARSVVVKGVESPERLLDETALFLHRVVADLPAGEAAHARAAATAPTRTWSASTVLVVDDDVRNIFALSSVLERRGMKVLTATTGSEAIALIESTPDVAIVLMDIMMPEMDGYETIAGDPRRTRPSGGCRSLPDGQGHEGRPREMPGGGRLRLSGQAGQYRTAALGAAHVAASLTGRTRAWTDEKVNILLVDDQPAKLLSLRGHPARSSARI